MEEGGGSTRMGLEATSAMGGRRACAAGLVGALLSVTLFLVWLNSGSTLASCKCPRYIVCILCAQNVSTGEHITGQMTYLLLCNATISMQG